MVQLPFDACRTDGSGGLHVVRDAVLRRLADHDGIETHYCSDCGRKAAMRDAAARYRRTDKYQSARPRRLERSMATK
jgi:hypothetical protein